MQGQRADEDLCGPLRLPLSCASHLHENESGISRISKIGARHMLDHICMLRMMPKPLK